MTDLTSQRLPKTLKLTQLPYEQERTCQLDMFFLFCLLSKPLIAPISIPTISHRRLRKYYFYILMSPYGFDNIFIHFFTSIFSLRKQCFLLFAKHDTLLLLRVMCKASSAVLLYDIPSAFLWFCFCDISKVFIISKACQCVKNLISFFFWHISWEFFNVSNHIKQFIIQKVVV